MNCPICHAPTKETEKLAIDAYKLLCLRCGNYYVDGLFKAILDRRTFGPDEIVKISGWIREQQCPELTETVLDSILSSAIPNIAARAHNLLHYLTKQYPKAGFLIHIPLGMIQKVITVVHRIEDEGLYQQAESILPLLAVSYSDNYDDLSFLLRHYLEKLDYLRFTSSTERFIITAEGWAFAERNSSNSRSSKIAFIAMWFDKDHVDKLLPPIQDAVKKTGYDPKLVISHEHNNDINDEIIALIKNCKFLIADFTGQRGGVYFESGLAKGLGKEVIWLCNKDEEENLHFDTSHYNFIFWEDSAEGLIQLQKRLKNRIEATIS